MRLFFAEDIALNQLNPEEAQHAIKVLRLKIGDNIELIDGKGKLTKATISQIDKRQAYYQVNSVQEFENQLAHLHIGLGPTKSNDRLEFMLEKMTEIGIGHIHLIQTQRTEKNHLNLERLIKKLISAAKQSHKYHLPKLTQYKNLNEFLAQTTFDQKFVAHLANDQRVYLGTVLKPNVKTCVLIGPEGDFTQQEIDLAFKNGYQAVTLGDFRLRTETAAIFACTLLNHARYL
jgi:16S rRNA (uracil1498-N3)-methyltransferase